MPPGQSPTCARRSASRFRRSPLLRCCCVHSARSGQEAPRSCGGRTCCAGAASGADTPPGGRNSAAAAGQVGPGRGPPDTRRSAGSRGMAGDQAAACRSWPCVIDSYATHVDANGTSLPQKRSGDTRVLCAHGAGPRLGARRCASSASKGYRLNAGGCVDAQLGRRAAPICRWCRLRDFKLGVRARAAARGERDVSVLGPSLHRGSCCFAAPSAQNGEMVSKGRKGRATGRTGRKCALSCVGSRRGSDACGELAATAAPWPAGA